VAVYDYIVETGVIVPDTSDTRAEVESTYKGIFGDDFITDPSTPEGALITADTIGFNSVAINNATLANQINPNLGGGVFLDGVMALSDLERGAGTPSLVELDLTGVASTPIPAGSIAQTADGVQFASIDAIVIGSGGTVSGQFQSVEVGPIGAAPNTITNIVSGIIGWETVNNPAAAIPGQTQQSDPSARTFRRQAIALQGQNTAAAVYSNARAVQGVTSVAYLENDSNASETIEGIVLAPNSVWVAVQGGADQDVAEALYKSKTPGAAWNGSTTVQVTDASSQQTQNVSFQRPTEVQIYVRVTARLIGATGTDPTQDIKTAIVDYANGEIDGEDGLGIGDDVSPFELAGAVNIQAPPVFVALCEVSDDNATFSTDTYVIAKDEIAVIPEANISVTIA